MSAGFSRVIPKPERVAHIRHSGCPERCLTGRTGQSSILVEVLDDVVSRLIDHDSLRAAVGQLHQDADSLASVSEQPPATEMPDPDEYSQHRCGGDHAGRHPLWRLKQDRPCRAPERPAEQSHRRARQQGHVRAGSHHPQPSEDHQTGHRDHRGEAITGQIIGLGDQADQQREKCAAGKRQHASDRRDHFPGRAETSRHRHSGILRYPGPSVRVTRAEGGCAGGHAIHRKLKYGSPPNPHTVDVVVM